MGKPHWLGNYAKLVCSIHSNNEVLGKEVYLMSDICLLHYICHLHDSNCLIYVNKMFHSNVSDILHSMFQINILDVESFHNNFKKYSSCSAVWIQKKMFKMRDHYETAQSSTCVCKNYFNVKIKCMRMKWDQCCLQDKNTPMTTVFIWLCLRGIMAYF